MVGGKVDGQILFSAKSEKTKSLFGPRGEKRNFYLVPNDSYEKLYLAVKGLIDVAFRSISWYHEKIDLMKFIMNVSWNIMKSVQSCSTCRWNCSKYELFLGYILLNVTSIMI